MRRDPYPGLDGRDPDEVDCLALRIAVWCALIGLAAVGVIWVLS